MILNLEKTDLELIKEAVREAIKEEILKVFSENKNELRTATEEEETMPDQEESHASEEVEAMSDQEFDEIKDDLMGLLSEDEEPKQEESDDHDIDDILLSL